MTEQTIQAKIKKYLESQGAYVVKVVRANRAGVPDILVCLRGKFVALEVKTPKTKGNVSELQDFNLRKISEAGGFSYVVTSVEDVKKILFELN